VITLDEAAEVVLANLPPGAHIHGKTEYQGMYLFLAPNPDPLEGKLLPFFSVDPQTGAFRDFDPQAYDNPLEVLDLLDPPS
jgi:hypothetical protein